MVKGLWDGWEPGAKVMDVESGRFFDPARVHELRHRGKYFSVRGPLNVSRCPQGHPVIFQAGSSRAGQAFAARHADVVLAVQINFELARDFYAVAQARCLRGRAGPRPLQDPPRIPPGGGRHRGRGEGEARHPRELRRRVRRLSHHDRSHRPRLLELSPRRTDTGPSPTGGSPGLRAHDADARVPCHPHPCATSTTTSRSRGGT